MRLADSIDSNRQSTPSGDSKAPHLHSDHRLGPYPISSFLGRRIACSVVLLIEQRLAQRLRRLSGLSGHHDDRADLSVGGGRGAVAERRGAERLRGTRETERKERQRLFRALLA